jgi:hypothetical protein
VLNPQIGASEGMAVLGESHIVTRQDATPLQALPSVTAQALTDQPYVITARSSTGDLPESTQCKSSVDKRGKDMRTHTPM